MSKIAMDRPRYIAFRIESARPLARRAFQNALRGRAKHDGVDPDALQLTRYEFPHGIVRAPHELAPALRALLPRITFAVEENERIEVRVATLSTGGTLRALTTRLGILQERGEKTA